MVPALKGDGLVRGKPIFWHSPVSRPYSTGDTDSSAVRIGDYKLIDWYNTGHVELYDLVNDPGEQNNLAASKPDRLQVMMQGLIVAMEQQHALYPVDKTDGTTPLRPELP